MTDSPTGKLDDRKPSTSHDVDVDVGRDGPDIVLDEDTLDPVYTAKARILNKAIQDIGMGRYQWQVNTHTVLFYLFPVYIRFIAIFPSVMHKSLNSSSFNISILQGVMVSFGKSALTSLLPALHCHWIWLGLRQSLAHCNFAHLHARSQ